VLKRSSCRSVEDHARDAVARVNCQRHASDAAAGAPGFPDLPDELASELFVDGMRVLGSSSSRASVSLAATGICPRLCRRCAIAWFSFRQ
jgi:hypothetical protein